ncbi:hypothetical protein EAS61_17915 [Bradyrhizobium zhanjiangense]|uniref:Uncharacterized protein n=1 Tax=Bradyrhizobium zhanjiangense TaxID=1325107 RepID=A0A4Q0QN64_9BRAD|nr:hypothetical protein EAS61_17915 [Bradyrhizobium zhanjiangense]
MAAASESGPSTNGTAAPRTIMVQRRGAKSHNAIDINDHPGWFSERALRVLRGLRKRYRFTCAASVELNSVASFVQLSDRARDQISFELSLFVTRIQNVIALAETVGSLLSADGGWHNAYRQLLQA